MDEPPSGRSQCGATDVAGKAGFRLEPMGFSPVGLWNFHAPKRPRRLEVGRWRWSAADAVWDRGEIATYANLPRGAFGRSIGYDGVAIGPTQVAPHLGAWLGGIHDEAVTFESRSGSGFGLGGRSAMPNGAGWAGADFLTQAEKAGLCGAAKR